jgi:hypothetical protein
MLRSFMKNKGGWLKSKNQTSYSWDKETIFIIKLNHGVTQSWHGVTLLDNTDKFSVKS